MTDVDFDICDGGKTAKLKLSKELYEKKAVMAVAHRFSSRGTINIHPLEDAYVSFSITPKKTESLGDLVDEINADLIEQQLRCDLEKEFGAIRELVVRHAFSPIKDLNKEIQAETNEL